MRVTADTNILVRIMTEDDKRQSGLAERILAEADLVALPLPALCELAWVLTRGYKIPPAQIATVIRRLISSVNVAVSHPAVEAGLAILDAGGDFADGVIAFEGARLGAETFVSFDKRAVTMMQRQGLSARLLA